MTRGKYGQSAATRRAIQGAETEVSVYQKKVVELLASNKAMAERIGALETSNRAEVRRLKAERNEGVSPMLSVVQAENARLKERAEKAERDFRLSRNQFSRAFKRMRAHFTSEHGCLEADSLEAVSQIIGPFEPVDGEWGDVTVQVEPAPNLDPKYIEQFQRAKGQRR